MPPVHSGWLHNLFWEVGVSRCMENMSPPCSASLIWLLFFQLSDFPSSGKSTQASCWMETELGFVLTCLLEAFSFIFFLIPCLTCTPYQHNQPLEIQCEATVQCNRICALRTQYTSNHNEAAAAVPQLWDLSLFIFVSDIVPVGIIAVCTVGSSILLLIFLLALGFFLYRQRKGSEYMQSSLHWACVHVCACMWPCALRACLSLFVSSTLSQRWIVLKW